MLLEIEAAGLVVLSVALAGPVSARLAAARWPVRSPRAALFLWQAVGLGAGLGILTAGLTLAAGSLDNHWLSGVVAMPRDWSRLGVFGWAGAVLTVGFGAWLVGATATSALRVASARRAHRRGLDVVADSVDVRPAGPAGPALRVRLVDHPCALAYCLPGLRPRVVLSAGALRTLPGTELTAVLAHERAHARGRHDLVIQPFVAWAKTFPFLPTAPRAAAAVDMLVEMLADDAALRECEPDDLESALRRLAEEQHVAVQATNPTHQLAARLSRLSSAQPPLSRAWGALIYCVAATLVIAPPLTLLLS